MNKWLTLFFSPIQSLFGEGGYAKPFLVTYINTSIFVVPMIPILLKEIFVRYRAGNLRASFKRIFCRESLRSFWTGETYYVVGQEEDEGEGEGEAFIKPGDGSILPATRFSDVQREGRSVEESTSEYLELVPTARYALAFCLLWFGANYFAMACLQYTTVASTTILTSTSSVWTLLIGAISRIERFTWRKLCGVLASIVGIVLISRVDLSAPATDTSSPPAHLLLMLRTLVKKNNKNDTSTSYSTPKRSVGEIALGDALALLSAIIYGLYTIMLKQTTLKAAPRTLNMVLFFSLVGLFNIILFLPVFPILHFTGLETFEFPPSAHVWIMLISMSLSSMVSDVAWAYAMVMTSPLVATVALSLNIPFSLIGEMVIQGRYEGWIYWVGAMVVVGSFVFVDREEVKDEIAKGGIEVGVDEDGLRERRSLVLEDGLLAARGYRRRSEVEDGDGSSGSGDDDEDDRRRDRFQRQANGYTDLDR